MDTQKAYKHFIHGRYFSEGLRVTAGIVIPSFIAAWFGHLQIGLVISIGTLCVSITDAPGPIHHRMNGMVISGILCSLIAIITYHSIPSSWLLGSVIVISGFIFSMLTVYGNRASAIGIAVLIMMVLSLAAPIEGTEIWFHAIYILMGAAWYILYSQTLYRIRPYKLIQQILGEYISGISDYLKGRSAFYNNFSDPSHVYKNLLIKQVAIDQTQQLLSELLFKTRAIVKESTRKGRTLLKIYLEVTDLYESIMTTYQDYTLLHQQFGDTGIMQEFQEVIVLLSDSLHQIGLAIKTGEQSIAEDQLLHQLKVARNKFETLRITHMKGIKIDDFVSLGRIMANLEDLAEKIFQLHALTGLDIKIKKSLIGDEMPDKSEDIRFKLFVDNLHFQSNIFRHSLRVGIALMIGFIISQAFNIGHSYWILLTIIVILKPAYSLSKQRNKDRLIGTIMGIVFGIIILFATNDRGFLLVLMIISMAISFINVRPNYFISVLFTTVYMLIFFHLMYPVPIMEVLKDRLIDTAIGSGISLLASLFIIPMWQQTTIHASMIEMLQCHKSYFTAVALPFTKKEEIDLGDIRKKRRGVLIRLANLTDEFNRMLSEPKLVQKNTGNVYQFVVVSHTIVSHLATLSYFLKLNDFRTEKLHPLINNTITLIDTCIAILSGQREPQISLMDNADLNNFVKEVMDKRKKEIQNGQLETPTKKMLVSVKSVTDQFNFIFRSAVSLLKIVKDA